VEKLNIIHFNVSNGYISRFVKRNNLKYETKCGESEFVDENLVIKWKSEMTNKYRNYEPKDDRNKDETGLF
jgi:hypothetical protein